MRLINRIPPLKARGGPRTDELRRVRSADGAQVPASRSGDRVVASVCGYCSTGCSLDVHLDGAVPVNLTPTRSYPVNTGSACPKGWEALAPMTADGRGLRPTVRRGRRTETIGWNNAFEEFCQRVRRVQAEHGPDSVAFLSTGQIATEEMALLGAVAKFGLGMVHGDGNTRQCMATAVAAYKECFGFDAPPYSYRDLEESDVVVLVGSNLAVAHPILFERLQHNPHQPEVIVVDPRATETAMASTLHLAIAPKSDQVLLYGIARELIRRGAIDAKFVAAHTSGFDDYARHVERFTPEEVCTETGLDPTVFQRTVDIIAEGQRVSFWWTMGVNQGHSATRTAQAIIALALMTGSIGRPGTGANSITGQCNAMGSRLFSNTASLFAGRSFTDESDRNAVADVLGIDVASIPDRPSWSYDQIIEGIARGDIKGLWVIATNPAHSWINQLHLQDMLGRLDLLVVQDMYSDTETARMADLYFPAAGWSEKEGTFINSERRIGRVRRTNPPPGEARTDFEIVQGIAEEWGCGPMFRSWRNPEAVFGILQELSRGRPCDITGVDGYSDLDGDGVQWPAPDGADRAVDRRLFEDGRFFTPEGRALFVADDPVPPPERPSERFPLVLLTGRGSTAQWHTQTRTARSPVLARLSPDRLYVELSATDAGERGIRSGDRVRVSSRRGEIDATAFVTPTVATGQVFLPMHDRTVNVLTSPAFDPQSRQPGYKYAAVQVVCSSDGAASVSSASAASG